jgi:DNA helicase HerA-like ATPase
MRASKFVLSNTAADYSAAMIAQELPGKLTFCDGGIYVGKSIGYRIPVFLDIESLINPHISIMGTTGSGKTHLSKVLLAGYAIDKGYNVIVLDWNGEYCRSVEDIGGKVYKLGEVDRVSVFEIFKNLKEAVRFISEQSGLNDDEHAALYRMFKPDQRKKKKTYAQVLKSSKDSNRQIKKKLGSILSLGALEDGGISLEALSCGVVSIDLSAVASYEDKGFYSKMVLKGILSNMYISGRKDNIERILILDEAWKHIANDNDIGKFFRESRKYGFGIIATSQLASDLKNDIIGNSACFFVFKLQNDSDIKALSSAGITGDHSPAELNRGECIFSVSFKAYEQPYSAVISIMPGDLNKVFCIRSGNMEKHISKADFEKMLRDYFDDGNKAHDVVKSIESADNAVDVEALVVGLKEAGLSRANILLFLSELGIDEIFSMDVYNAVGH